MIKINGYWYTLQEAKEALEKKGYSLFCKETKYESFSLSIWWATKDGETVKMADAVRREFEKKPPLV